MGPVRSTEYRWTLLRRFSFPSSDEGILSFADSSGVSCHFKVLGPVSLPLYDDLSLDDATGISQSEALQYPSLADVDDGDSAVMSTAASLHCIGVQSRSSWRKRANPRRLALMYSEIVVPLGNVQPRAWPGLSTKLQPISSRK